MTKDQDTIERAKRLREALLDAALVVDSLIAMCGPQEASQPPPSGGVVAATEEIAVHVIEAVGKPLTTRALLPLVQEQIPVAGKNPLSTLSARLSSAKRLFRVPEGWAVKP
jgi:hypothetical protein